MRSEEKIYIEEILKKSKLNDFIGNDFSSFFYEKETLFYEIKNPLNKLVFSISESEMIQIVKEIAYYFNTTFTNKYPFLMLNEDDFYLVATMPPMSEKVFVHFTIKDF